MLSSTRWWGIAPKKLNQQIIRPGPNSRSICLIRSTQPAVLRFEDPRVGVDRVERGGPGWGKHPGPATARHLPHRDLPPPTAREKLHVPDPDLTTVTLADAHLLGGPQTCCFAGCRRPG